MTRLTLATALLAGFYATSAAAMVDTPEVDNDHIKPTLSLGLSFAFGAQQPVNTGISLRVLSTNEVHHAAATAGVTYYLGTGSFGFDAGVAYNLNSSFSSAITYDFINQGAVFSLSGANLKKKNTAPDIFFD